MAKYIGIVDTPKLSELKLSRELARRHAPVYDPARISRLPLELKQSSVLLLQDVFTTFYEPNVVLACYDLLTRLGYTVYVLPFRENGKGLHVKGFLGNFKRVAQKSALFLEEAAQTGVDIVGIEPAVVLTYRDEYRHALGEPPRFKVSLVQEWLAAKLPTLRLKPQPAAHLQYRLFGHCTERTAEPRSQERWVQVFQAFGAKLSVVDVGCCGMCGIFGHETVHREESVGVFRMSWSAALPSAEADRERVLASGHSCRSQVKRLEGFVPLHPLEALERLTRH